TIDARQAKRAAEGRQRSPRKIGLRRGLIGEQRVHELIGSKPNTERILAVEEEERSRACGRRGVCHPVRSPPCRLCPSGTSGLRRAPAASPAWDDHTG